MLSHALVATTTLNFAATGTSDIPLIKTLADGNLLVVWTSEYDPVTGRSVWMHEFDGKGRPVGVAAQVSPLGMFSELASVTVLPDGGVAICWDQSTPTASPSYNNWNVHARVIDGAGAMGDAFRLNGAKNGAEGAAQLAKLPDGSLAALWIKSEGGVQKLIYRSFDASGVPARPDRELASSTGALNDPKLVTLPDGSVMAVWLDNTRAEDPGLPWHRVAHFVQLNTAGTAQSFAFSPDTPADAHDAQVLVLNDGRLFLSWAEITFDGAGTWVTRKAAFLTQTGELSEPITLTPQVYSGSPDTSVIQLSDGRIAVSWSISDQMGMQDTALQYFDPREAAITLQGAQTTVRWWGTAFADSLTGGSAADRIWGADGSDTVLGKAGDDQLLGDGGNDLLRGGAGNDNLSGGAGRDRLWGNAGADSFILKPDVRTDRVMDYTDGQDRIDLAAFGFATAHDALAAFSQSDNGVLFALGTTQAIFVGLSLSALDATDLLI